MLALRLALGLSALVALASPAPAQFSSTKVVETGVSYPGVGTFNALGFPTPTALVRPSLTANGLVAFGGTLTTGHLGIFTATGPSSVSAFATTQTSIPGGGGSFVAFANTSVGLSGNVVAFGGNGFPGPPGNTGVYSNATGSLAPVVNPVTAFPAGGTFATFSAPAVSGTTVAFSGSNVPMGPPIGVFTRTGGGAITTVANTSTPVPGGNGGNFTDFTDGIPAPPNVFLPNISGSNVVFGGRGGGVTGLFTNTGGPLTAVATTATTMPGAATTFTNFGAFPAIDGNTIAFFGAGGGRQGVYSWTNGTRARIADTTTIAPGGTTPFASFLPLSVATSGGHVAFVGMPAGGPVGLYTDLTGSLTRVVQIGDMIDGKTVTRLDIGQFAFHGDRIAVLLNFSNGSQGIYTFTPVPEPTGVLAVATTAGAIALLARRRNRVVA